MGHFNKYAGAVDDPQSSDEARTRQRTGLAKVELILDTLLVYVLGLMVRVRVRVRG